MALVKNKVKVFAELVKIEHTIFGLPFAYMGALLALKGIPSLEQLLWITAGVAGARNVAMAANRVVDRAIDKANPRTAQRHIPQGIVSVREVVFFIVMAFLLFTYAVYKLSPRHLVFVPAIGVCLIGYSYTKRFTSLSHMVLGLTNGLAALGGWIAVTQRIELGAVLLWLVAAFWVGGFDIIYATYDLDFDKEYGLYSMPLSLGLKNALFMSKLFHILVVLLLFSLQILLGLGLWFFTGIMVTAILLYYEHSLISPQDLSRVDFAFFNVNGIISMQLLIFTVLDILI